MSTNKVIPQDDDNVPLVKTRERRANAGNRMRELLEQELEGMSSYRKLVGDGDEDDDDVDELDLLFQEDEGDEDFEIGEDDKLTSGSSKNVSRLTGETKTGRAEMDLEEDMMLSSDSGESSTENGDAEDEEAFIRRQERLLKRKERTRKLAPKIVKRIGSDADATTNKRRRTKHSGAAQLNPESLLLTERRVSTRKSVIENRHRIYERLSKARAKRQLIREKLRKTRESAVQKVLTQEDRLRIAHETEVKNLQSLNRFKEQEDLKKQSRLALQQRNKLKFKPNELVETFLSISCEVSPSSELADRKYWELEMEKRDKKRSKKKYGNKKTKKSTEGEHTREKTNQNDVKVKVESSISVEGLGDESLVNSKTQSKDTDGQLPTEHEISQGDETVCQDFSKQSSIGTTLTESSSMVVTSDIKIDSNTEGQDGEELTNVHTGDRFVTLDSGAGENKEEIVQDSTDDPRSSSLTTSSKKQVTFDEKPQIMVIENDDDDDDGKVTSNGVVSNANQTVDVPSISDGCAEAAFPALDDKDPATELVYEGPNQLVGKNFLTRFYFLSDTVGVMSPPDERELEYFGEKGSVTPDRQGTYEPLLRSKMIITPESIVDDEIRENIIPDLDFLSNYRAFGEYEKREKKGVIQDNKVDNSGLKITTACPVGLYTTNNNVRKHCFINNKPCQYFDPNLGVPYADLDGYNIIKELLRGSSDSSYRWCGFRNGGIFLNVRERPARGVPEGF